MLPAFRLTDDVTIVKSRTTNDIIFYVRILQNLFKNLFTYSTKRDVFLDWL